MAGEDLTVRLSELWDTSATVTGHAQIKRTYTQDDRTWDLLRKIQESSGDLQIVGRIFRLQDV